MRVREKDLKKLKRIANFLNRRIAKAFARENEGAREEYMRTLDKLLAKNPQIKRRFPNIRKIAESTDLRILSKMEQFL